MSTEEYHPLISPLHGVLVTRVQVGNLDGGVKLSYQGLLSAGRPDKYMDNPVEYRKEEEASNPDISYGKNIDAKWIKKGKKSYYGYKVFASVNDEHGFIQTVHTESAEA